MTLDEKVLQYRKVPVSTAKHNDLEILEIKLMESKVKTELKGRYEDRLLLLTLGITCVGSPLAKVTHVEQVSCQASIASCLNPTDFYFRVMTKCKPGIAAGYGRPEQIKFGLEFYVDQRPATELGNPWGPVAGFNLVGCDRHLSFDVGMKGGYNFWRMYHLDYRNPENIKFDFVKEYCYVQGQVMDNESG
ncbi:hypothetical protein HY639_04035 [Candidatus Woesearchaeota archaeon]|nr:hypothetical protein [Candidatus Woesearchaeota archaeon]